MEKSNDDGELPSAFTFYVFVIVVAAWLAGSRLLFSMCDKYDR